MASMRAPQCSMSYGSALLCSSRPARCFSIATISTPAGNQRKFVGKSFSLMYEHGASFDHGYLKVSELHTLYYETFGNPVGKPAVFLHGGPGAGCVPRHAGFFDPQFYKVILFDQRGCGKSSPRGCLEENTTWDLVEDLEKLRKHLRVNKWLVMGGSWGVTLALAYGQAHPGSVAGFILRGVCTLREEEIDWFYKQGANYLFPFSWEELLSLLEPSERTDVIPAFYKRLTSNDAESRSQAAKAWLRWEMGLSFFKISQTAQFWDGKHYATHSLEEKRNYMLDKSAQKDVTKDNAHGAASDSSPSKSSDVASGKVAEGESGEMTAFVAQARLECHYFLNSGFLKENQLLEGVLAIHQIPCVIIHGRYDFVCPVKNAFDLHRVWPEAKLCIVMDAGHSMYEKSIARELVSATEQFRSLQY